MRLRWTRDFPRKEAMAVARMELGEPVSVSPSLLAVGAAQWPALFLIDRVSGWMVRSIPARGPVQAPVAAVPGAIYFTDVSGGVHAADSAGTVRWTKVLSAPIYAAPVPAGDLLLVQTTGDEVAALAVSTGEVKWIYRHDAATAGELDILGSAGPLVDGDRVLAGFSDGTLVALASADGRLIQQGSLDPGRFRDVEATPVRAGDLLVVGSFGGPVMALDAQTLAEVWRQPSGLGGTPVVEGQDVYLSATDGTVKSLDLRTGAVRWSWPPPKPLAPATGDAEAGTGTSLGMFPGLGTLDLQWPKLHGQQYTPPVLVGGHLVVGADHGTLYLIDRYTGTISWQWKPDAWPEGISAAPLVAGRDLFVLTNAGRLYSLESEGLPEDLSAMPSRRLSRALGW